MKQILSKVKTKYCEHTHKFSICIPKTVAQAQAIDKENGDTLWWDAIVMEMQNVCPTFERWEKKESNLIGYQKIKCHFVFDIKMGETSGRKHDWLQMEIKLKHLQLSLTLPLSHKTQCILLFSLQL